MKKATAITPQPDLPPLKGGKERMGGLSCALMLALLMICQPAKAEEYTYSPDHCAFTMTFPEKPVIEESCKNSPLDEKRDDDDANGDAENCHEVVSFNKVFSADSGLHVRASCSEGGKEQYERYSGAEMKGALEKLLTTEDVSDHKTSFDRLDGEQVKRAGFLGYGKRNDAPATIIGQLWLSPQSILTLQVEVTGASDKQADAMLASILRSLQKKGDGNAENQAPDSDSEAKDED